MKTMVNVNISSGHIEGAADLDLKGRILHPCIAPLAVNGKAARVRFSREVINAGYAKLKARLARGGGIEMRLVHPDLNPLSIPYGRANSFRHDPTTGSVYLAGSVALPEVEHLFDAQAREALLKMGLSMRAPAFLTPCTDGEADYDATELGELVAVDIVDQGAFSGSSIVQHLPAGLMARISSAHAKGAFTVTSQSVGTSAAANDKDSDHMKIESVEQVPEEVRALVPQDQLPAYITAYNGAIDAGMEPAAAHAAALQAIGVTPPVGQDDTMKPEELQAQLTAASTARVAAEAKAQELQAQLSARDAQNATLDARLKLVEADLSAAKTREDDRDAQVDVDTIIRTGVAPAMREGLLSARKAMPEEAFVKLAAAIPRSVPVGEKGRTGEHAGTGQDELSAARQSVKDIGVENILSSGVHMRDAHIALVLKTEYATHPQVARISARLAPIAAKATQAVA